MTTQTGDLRGWRRQLFSLQPTKRQLIADVLFGVVMPIVCFVLDPAVFREGIFGSPSMLESIHIWVYLAFTIGTFALVMWLLFAPFVGVTASMVAGVLLIGAVCATIIGVIIFPGSLVGIIFMGIGLLGFTPFATAIIYFRNGWRALQTARFNSRGDNRPVLVIVTTAAMLAVGIPAIVQWLDNRWAGTFFWDVYHFFLRLGL